MNIYLFLSLVSYHAADFLTFQDCLVDLKRIKLNNDNGIKKYIHTKSYNGKHPSLTTINNIYSSA